MDAIMHKKYKEYALRKCIIWTTVLKLYIYMKKIIWLFTL